MSTISFSRRLTKRCLHRLMVLAKSSVPAASPASQLVTAATGSGLVVENVRGFWSQSPHEVPRIGVEDVRKGSFDLRDECSRQQRGYARSNSEKARPDGDAVATQMIKYAATCRNQGKLNHFVSSSSTSVSLSLSLTNFLTLPALSNVNNVLVETQFFSSLSQLCLPFQKAWSCHTFLGIQPLNRLGNSKRHPVEENR